jgi:hypothetical protein
MLLIGEFESRVQLLWGFQWYTEYIQEVFYSFGQKFRVHVFQSGEQLTNIWKNSQALSYIIVSKNYSDAHLLNSYKTYDAQTLQHVYWSRTGSSVGA